MRRSKTWDELSSRLEDAFQQRRCYVPRSYAEAQTLRRRIRDGSVVEPFQRLFAHAERWKQLSRLDQERYLIRGYAYVHPNVVFCSLSAAVMHGLPVSYSLLGSLYLQDSTSNRRRGHGIERCCRPDPALERVDGVTVVSLIEATVECLCMCDFEDGLAIADGYLHITRADASYLQSEVERLARRRRGVEMARKVASWSDARAESGGESIARAIMIKAGIIPSDLQRKYVDPLDSKKTYRVDFVFELIDGSTVLGEFDGRAKYEDETLRAEASTIDVLMAERQRESRLTLMDVRIVRFNWNDLHKPGRLLQMLAAAGVTPETIVKRAFS